MTMALMNHISSTGIFVGILTLLIAAGILYVFYPALSISKTRPKVTENVVSAAEHADAEGKKLVAPRNVLNHLLVHVLIHLLSFIRGCAHIDRDPCLQ
jgi:hypothetical protein